MSVPEQSLNRAIQLSLDGRQRDARTMLKAILQDHPGNESAWIWFIRTLDRPEDKIKAAQIWVNRFPESNQARQALNAAIRDRDKRASTEQVTHRKMVTVPVSMMRVLLVALLVTTVLFTAVIGIPLYENMRSRAEALENQVILLTDQNTDSQSQFQGLFNLHSNLQKEFKTLSGDLNSLDYSYSDLQEEYNRLQTEYNQLTRDYARLQSRYARLSDQFHSYQGQAISPPFIAVSGRNIDVSFSRMDGSQMSWSIPFDRFEWDVQRGIRARTGLFGMGMPILKLTHAENEIWVTDFRRFVDSTPFTEVMTDLYNQAPDDRTFITETWSIIGQMITYVYEEDEIPRYPLETLVSGGGDCEDTAILFASMIQAAPVDWTVEMVYINSKSPADPMGMSDHVIIFIDTGREHYYVETTRNDVMEPYTDGIVGWFLPLN